MLKFIFRFNFFDWLQSQLKNLSPTQTYVWLGFRSACENRNIMRYRTMHHAISCDIMRYRTIHHAISCDIAWYRTMHHAISCDIAWYRTMHRAISHDIARHIVRYRAISHDIARYIMRYRAISHDVSCDIAWYFCCSELTLSMAALSGWVNGRSMAALSRL